MVAVACKVLPLLPWTKLLCTNRGEVGVHGRVSNKRILTIAARRGKKGLRFFGDLQSNTPRLVKKCFIGTLDGSIIGIWVLAVAP